MNTTPLLSDIDPLLESIFSGFGVVAQGILESLPWIEIPGNGSIRRWKAIVYSDHSFWTALWRPNKSHWRKLGFSIAKPAENWIVSFQCSDLARSAGVIEASRAVVPEGEVPIPPGLAYFEYQKAGIEFLARTPAAFLADEPGVGKTIQVCGLLNLRPDIKSLLVVCPASVKFVWARELEKWLLTPRGISIAGTRSFDVSSEVIIVNYDLLRRYSGVLKDVVFDLVVLDEAHYIKTASAQRTKAAKAIALSAKRKVLLTGTPVMSRPGELWSLLNLLDAKTWGAFFPFAMRYCAAYKTEFNHWDFSGASNLEELSARLRSSGTFLRRTKADVLPQLPEVIRQVVPLDVDTSPLLEELTEALATKMGFDPLNPPFEIDPTAIPFEMVSAIRHETGVLKVEAAIRFITEQMDGETSDVKAIVFAHHHDVLTALSAGLPGSVKVTGESSMKNRQLAVDEFQNDPAVKYFIASTTAMGVGITLTAASRIFFVESDWVPAVLEQAESRAHRIGQASSVLVQCLVIHDTIDERIMNILVAKMEVIGAVLGSDESDSEDEWGVELLHT
jgi:SWI/SNF-related matrix-associated actin-dependent regulator 1 of chromatin subfamily A